MFSQLSEQLQKTFKSLTGRGHLTPENIQEAVQDVRRALLAADVARSVVDRLIDDLQQRAVGEEVLGSLRPGEVFVNLVYQGLVDVLAQHQREVRITGAKKPRIMVMAGLQGSGKTTSTAKLAKFIAENWGQQVAVASCDIARPGALEQLRVVAEQAGVHCHHELPENDVVKRVKGAIKASEKHGDDILLIDTAGRLHIDEELMTEMKAIVDVTRPIELFFVIDSMMGQDAARTAQAFSQQLPLTAVVLTKLDGDNRGGAALSAADITGCPILFAGVGEKVDQFQRFEPKRMADRILDRGDIVSLVEHVQKHVDEKEQKRLAKRMRKGVFTLEDYRRELVRIREMGGMAALVNHLPGAQQMAPMLDKFGDEESLKALEAVLNSMTMQEKLYPERYFTSDRAHKQKISRRKRIVKGSGTEPADFNKVLKQYKQMSKMMKKMKQPGFRQKLAQFTPEEF